MARARGTQADKLPKFKDEAEAGAFWDTHSPEDYPGEFREVEVRFARPLIKRVLAIELSHESLDALQRLANGQGIGPADLVRRWVLERFSPSRMAADYERVYEGLVSQAWSAAG